MSSRALGVVVAALLLSTCWGADWEGEVETVGGVPVVVNPALPMYGPGEVSIERIWTAPETFAVTAGGESGAGATVPWSRPALIAFGGAGLFVVDGGVGTVVRLDPATGEVLGTSRSAAPGGPEGGDAPASDGAGAVAAMAVLDDEVVLVRRGGGDLISLSPDLDYLGTTPFGGRVSALLAAGPDLLLARTLREGGAAWIFLNGLGEERVLTFPPSAAAVARGAGLESRTEEFFCPGGVSTGRASILRVRCQVMHIQEVDLQGNARREFLAERAGAGEGAAPFFRRAIVDPASGVVILWEQPEEDVARDASTLHLFSPEGVYLAAVAIGERWLDLAYGEGRMYALAAGSDSGGMRPAAYRIDLPDRLLEAAAVAYNEVVIPGR